MTISAWIDFAKADSPDGRFVAAYSDASEIAMGAPTSGVLTISDKTTGDCLIRINGANASFVWSSDSAALAFPRWTKGRNQQLVVVDVTSLKTEPLQGEYRVLELSSFRDGVIEGVDSPIYQPRTIRVAVRNQPNHPTEPLSPSRGGSS